MDFDAVDLTDDVKRAPVKRAENLLTEIRSSMRNEADQAVKYYASELMSVILILREAME